jgi:phage-related protein
MIYNENTVEYRVKFYRDIKSGKIPIKEYIDELPIKEQAKILKYIEFSRVNQGYLDEPYSRHIKGKIRELRIDFGRRRHRIFYTLIASKIIILLHAFVKKTAKTPAAEIIKAENNYYQALNNLKFYE